MEHTELALTGYIVVAWRSTDPFDKDMVVMYYKDMVVLYFETAQDLDAWTESGNTAYKITPVTSLLPATLKCVSRAPGYPVAYVSNTD